MGFLALHAIAKFFSLHPDSTGAWADASSIKLALQAEGNRCRVAVARSNEVAVFSAPCNAALEHGDQLPQPDTTVTLLHASTCMDAVTDLAWLALRQSPTAPDPGPSSQDTMGSAGHVSDAQFRSEGLRHRQAVQRASHGSDTHDPADPSTGSPPGPAAPAGSFPSASYSYLLLGTSAGYLQLHNGSGQLLLRQRLHTSAVQRIQLRSARMGISPGPDQEDITITFQDSIARISFSDLQVVLAAAQPHLGPAGAAAAAGRSGGFFGAGSSTASTKARGKSPAMGPIPFQRWDLPRGARCCLEAVCMGLKPQDLYSALQGPRPGRGDRQRLLFAAGGEAPVLYSLEAKAQASHGTLAMLQDLVSSLTSVTSSAVGMARAAGARAVNTPASLAAGLRSLVLAPLFMTTGAASPDEAQSSAPPVSTFDNVPTSSQSRVETASLGTSFKDEQRVITCLVPAPSGPLLAAVDTLGRLLLVDGVHMTLIRMWKGYRDAQCAWLEVPQCWIRSRAARLHKHPAAASGAADAQPVLLQSTCGGSQQHGTARAKVQNFLGGAEDAADVTACKACRCSRCSLLAVYVPRRQVVEVWQAQEGVRLLALTQVGLHCRLLAARQVGASRQDAAEESGSCLAPGPACCFLFDGAQGAITDLGVLVRGKR